MNDGHIVLMLVTLALVLLDWVVSRNRKKKNFKHSKLSHGEVISRIKSIYCVQNVEKYALQGQPTYKMPQILNDDSFNFSFSGIKSHVNNIVHNEKQRGNEIREYDIARSFQDCVTTHLVDKTKKALLKYNLKCVAT